MTPVNVTETYAKHHLPGYDCRLTAARNLFSCAGIDEPYHNMFGLSSCTSFTYRKRPFTRVEQLVNSLRVSTMLDHFRIVIGVKSNCIEDLAYVTGSTFFSNMPTDSESSLEHMHEFLENGIPVVVAIAPKVLSSFTQRPFNLPEFLRPLEFGSEWVVLTAIDDPAGTATIFHSMSGQPVVMPLAVFQHSRTFGDDCEKVAMPSNRRWMTLVPPMSMPPRKEMYRMALAKTVYRMSEEQTGFEELGLRGLRVFTQEMPAWRITPEFPVRQFTSTVWLMRLLSETVSAGGFGRRMFSMFLTGAASLFESMELRKAAELYTEAAGEWTELVKWTQKVVLEDRSGDLSGDMNIRTLCNAIYEQECRAIELTSKFVRG